MKDVFTCSFNEDIHVETELFRNDIASLPITITEKVPGILFFRHILINYIHKKQMVSVNLAQFALHG